MVRRKQASAAAALAGLLAVVAGGDAAALVVAKRATSAPRPAPGDPVVFEIELRNDTAAAVTNHYFDDIFPPCLTALASCAQVSCTGAATPGTCTVNAGGFSYTGFGLAAAGQPGDRLTCTVTTTAGTMPGDCENTVVTTDPRSGQDIIETASVTIVALGLTKSLAVGQSPTAVVGDPVVFEIAIQNNTSIPISGATLNDLLDPCFTPLASCAAVSCTGGASVPTCTVNASGFDLSGIDLSPRGSAGDRLLCTVSTTAGTPPGTCTNLASAFDPGSGQDLTDDASVVIGGLLDVTKALEPGQNPNPAPGDPVTFVITLSNNSPNTPITNHSFDDLLEACYDPLPGCGAVSCTGGSPAGSCAVNANGFTQSGFGLAPRGQAGDTLTCTVTATAGGTAGLCRNTAASTDPVTGADVSATAQANITIGASLSIVKDLAPGQTENPPPNSPVDFVITIRNLSPNPVLNGTMTDTINDLCFRPVTDCSGVTCTGACGSTGCEPFPSGSGFFYNGWSLAPAGSAGDTITFTVRLITGNGLGPCWNQALTRDPATMQDLVSTRFVTISNPAAGTVQVSKRLAAGQAAVVPPGDPVVFEITVTNTTSPPAPLTGVTLSDTLDPSNCFAAFTSCAQLACIPAAPGCGTCTVVSPSRIDVTGINLAAPGSPGDARTYQVTVTAAATTFTTCDNTAVTASPAAAPSVATVTIDPGASTTCGLHRGVETSPTHTAPWLFTEACAPDPILPGPAVLQVGATADVEPLGVPAGFEITLYQLECRCTDVIRLVKNRAAVPPSVTLSR